MIDACGVAHPRSVGDEQTVGAWMNRVLNTQADVPAKLAAHPDAVERRAFLWATVASDFGVQLQFEPGCGNALPMTARRCGRGKPDVGGRLARVPRCLSLVCRSRMVKDAVAAATECPINLDD